MSKLTTLERRARLWLLLADRYEAQAEQEPKRRAYWLAEAAKARETAAA